MYNSRNHNSSSSLCVPLKACILGPLPDQYEAEALGLDCLAGQWESCLRSEDSDWWREAVEANLPRGLTDCSQTVLL